MFPSADTGPSRTHTPSSSRRRVRERSLAARDERSESPVAGTKEGRKLTRAGRPRPDGSRDTAFAAAGPRAMRRMTRQLSGMLLPRPVRCAGTGPAGPHARRKARPGMAPRSGAA